MWENRLHNIFSLQKILDVWVFFWLWKDLPSLGNFQTPPELKAAQFELSTQGSIPQARSEGFKGRWDFSEESGLICQVPKVNFCICSDEFWYHLGQLLVVWKTPCWNKMLRNIHQYPLFGWVFNPYLQETSTKPFKQKLWKKSEQPSKPLLVDLLWKKWIFLYISSPLESRWSFSSPNFFHPLPPCPKRRGKWLPSGVFFSQVDDWQEENRHDSK